MGFKRQFLGPKLGADERLRMRSAMFFALASMALVASMVLPYWNLELKAPQFPDGLYVSAYVNKLVGEENPTTGTSDLDELEDLNHYVGMPRLQDGAALERSLSIAAVIVFAGLMIAGFVVHSRWVVLFALPALLFPFVFLADLQYWLWNYGHSLDPRAPLAGAVGEFTPHIFGKSKIAQFDTNALPGWGLLLAFVASGLTAVALYYHRTAYKPLVEAAEAPHAPESEASAGPEPAGAGVS